MARNSIPTPDEALAGMAKVGAPREPMDGSVQKNVSYPSADTGKNLKVARKNTQAADPAAQGLAHRTHVVVTADTSERLGGQHKVTAQLGGGVPEAQATQRNGRIINPAIVRSRGSFDEGVGTSY